MPLNAVRARAETLRMGAVRSGFAGRLLGSMASGVIGVDPSGAVVLINAGAKRLLGCPEGSLSSVLGCDCRQVFASEPSVARLLVKAARGQQEFSRSELALRGGARGDGGTIGITLFPVRGSDGRRAGAAMLFRDLTPIERTEEQERLQGRLAALGQMAAGLAHELRNPLASMEVLAGLLRRRLPGEEDRQLVDELLGQMRDLSQIITTSLDFVRPAVPQRSPVEPVALLEGALSRVLPRPGVPVRVERHFEPVPSVEVDPELLTVTLANLIGNAVDAMQTNLPAERRLLLGVRCEDDPGADPGSGESRRELVWSVGDSGPGIAPELRDRIFYPFFTTRERGSGIGLATAQKVVASHGGRIDLSTRVGHGTTFQVRLPLDPPDEALE